MKIYRIQGQGHLGIYYKGTAYIKKDLPILIQIIVLFHEVGHHLDDKLHKFLFKINAPFTINSCLNKLWVLFFETKDELICRKWINKKIK